MDTSALEFIKEVETCIHGLVLRSGAGKGWDGGFRCLYIYMYDDDHRDLKYRSKPRMAWCCVLTGILVFMLMVSFEEKQVCAGCFRGR